VISEQRLGVIITEHNARLVQDIAALTVRSTAQLHAALIAEDSGKPSD